jgi:myo-inositol-1(or 4)-monophosphatase
MNLQTITFQIINLSKAVAKFVKSESLKFSSSDIEFKGLHNLVTYVDKQAEKMIISELSKLLPEAGFIAEEDPDLERADRFNWIVDPLDGTTNFIHSIPFYSISIALNDGDKTIMGIVYEISSGECFYSWKGGPAFLNEKEIKVTNQADLNHSLLATGFPYYDYSLLDNYLGLFKDLMQTTRGVRRLGSAALDLAYVAAGRFELFYEYGLNPWDVAAGAFLVEQAGGKVTDFKNENNYLFGKQIIASNKLTHHDFSSKLQSYFRI